MTIRNLRSAVAGIQQNRRIRAIALEVINGRATVKLAGSSQLLYGLSITGGTIVAGQEVYVDYTTGNPVVHSYQEDSPSVSLATRTKVREIIKDPEIPLSVSNHTHVESQITDLLHNAASIRGRTITTGSPNDGDTLLWDESSGSWLYGAGGEIEEAPIDGLLYGRKDGSWSEVTSSGSGIGASNLSELNDVNVGSQTDGQVLVWNEDTSKWIPGSISGEFSSISGGSAIYMKWDPDAPPETPSECDDEFNDTSLSGSWLEFDPNNLLTISPVDYGVWLTQTTRTGDNLVGIVKSVPNGDFTITTKVQLSSKRKNYSAAGLALFENPLDTSKKITTLLTTYNAGGMILEGINWNNHNSFNGAIFSHPMNFVGSKIYLRIRRNTTNYYFDYSLDGMAWMQYGSTITLSFTPTYFGIYTNNVGTGDTIKALFKFFRYKNSDITNLGILEGRKISIGTTVSGDILMTQVFT